MYRFSEWQLDRKPNPSTARRPDASRTQETFCLPSNFLMGTTSRHKPLDACEEPGFSDTRKYIPVALFGVHASEGLKNQVPHKHLSKSTCRGTTCK